MAPLNAPNLTSSRIRFVVAVLLILTLAVVLRWHGLGERSLWYDELITANASSGSIELALRKTRELSSAPVLHPYLLLLVERFAHSALAVRVPSAIAGTLAVLVLGYAAWKAIGLRGGLFAALVLAISASQIRYSQEVREYSLSVLIAALLIMFYLRAVGERAGHLNFVALCLLLVIAPLVQYGLALFGAAIILAMFTFLSMESGLKAGVLRGIIAAAALGAGSVITWLLTLRFQIYLFGAQEDRGFYFDPERDTNLVAFLADKGFELLSFLFPGPMMLGLVLPATLYFAWRCLVERRPDAILFLAVASIAIALAAFLLRLYPLGAVRQCLYLAPALVLAAAAGIEALTSEIPTSRRFAVTSLIVVTTLVAGMLNIHQNKPYLEQEDINSVLDELKRSAKLDDKVYIYYLSAPAIRFYRYQHPNLAIGDDHRENPEMFEGDVLERFHGHSNRIWLVFSHVRPTEDLAIIAGLGRGWRTERVVDARRAALYLAERVRSVESVK